MVFYPALRATELLAALVAGRLKLFPTPLAFVLCSHSLYPPFFFIPPSLYRLLLFLRRFGSIFRLRGERTLSAFGQFLALSCTHTEGFSPYLLHCLHTVFPRVGQKEKRREEIPRAKSKIDLKNCAA